MTYASSDSMTQALAECITLLQDLQTHAAANDAFDQLKAQIAESNPAMANLLEMLWREAVAGRRSAAFWQQICDVERDLTENLSANHFQLQQNYLRLMQEQ
ncbi:hypothetical protein HNI00_14780 [Thermoleptolyngbya oregonensis NK1-22]|uniref:Uncharacterized protein n=1 Tax=Thermoleptolyngbya oregonensis NK1-22 TaxID=2547457 RepID=A0AA96Y624_9CYAN|nr:hypothetical protein [Thermoleptolyngbya oregonensis]WOB44264.1 hypothetical protein HNI00_14780 [Thermoleptolyngbya oregonensis NK1-22]